MATGKVLTDEVMEFLSEACTGDFKKGDILPYLAKDGTVYNLKINAVFGSDDPELSDGFRAYGMTLLNDDGTETDQVVFVTRGTTTPEQALACYGEITGWPLFIKYKQGVCDWYTAQKNAGKSVSFSGLSLGGAMSQLLAGYIHQVTGDTLQSVVTFSPDGIEKTLTYEGVTYDFTGKVADLVHHYICSGDCCALAGNYLLEGTIYLYASNCYLDQAGRSGSVIRSKDYLMTAHYKFNFLKLFPLWPDLLQIKTMDSSERSDSGWNGISFAVDAIPEGLEDTNNTAVTIGDHSYVFNRAHAEFVLSMAQSGTRNISLAHASSYNLSSTWEALRATETGRQDFLGTILMMNWTSDIKVGISGSFCQGGKDYAVITLIGETEQGREFLYSFSERKFQEITEVVSDGNWMDIAGAQTYEVQFCAPGAADETPAEITGESAEKNYSAEVTNAMIEGISDCASKTFEVGDVFEYTSPEGLTYRLKYTESFGSNEEALDDGFRAAGVVLLDVDGVTETDEHFLFFRGLSGLPDAIAFFYRDAPALPIFAEHKQDVLEWYEKYEGQKITFSGANQGCILAQYFSGWLVNDLNKAPLERLVGFTAPAIVKTATYEDVSYNFITDKAVAQTVEFYRTEGDILACAGEYYQPGTVHLYGGDADFDQANGIKIHEYLVATLISGNYLQGDADQFTYLADFDTGYFAKNADYSDLAVEVDAAPEDLATTNIEAVTYGDKTYLFNTAYADAIFSVVACNLVNYDETLEAFFDNANKLTGRNHWEECRGTTKTELLAYGFAFNNDNDIQISTTDVTFNRNGDVYVVLEDYGTTYQNQDFLFNFNARKFVAMKDVASDVMTKSAEASVTLTLDDRTVVINSAETAFATYNLTQQYTTWKSTEKGEIVSGGIIQQQCRADRTVTVRAVTDGVSDVIFAKASGVWYSGFFARNVGCGTWHGTRESVSLSGMNRISDLYFGAETDNCAIHLTDDANGDALFIDDIFTNLPDGEKMQSRILNVDQIYAGAGNDLIDLTSQRYQFSDNSIEIHGGEGDDNLWAGASTATLLGEAGSDRLIGGAADDVLAGGAGDDSMHGGGGNDTFTFGENWGKDVVEQLADGAVTLWFASGSAENWDPSTMTYTDGDNRVKVEGVSEVTLKFGNDNSEKYASLAESGCFLD